VVKFGASVPLTLFAFRLHPIFSRIQTHFYHFRNVIYRKNVTGVNLGCLLLHRVSVALWRFVFAQLLVYKHLQSRLNFAIHVCAREEAIIYSPRRARPDVIAVRGFFLLFSIGRTICLPTTSSLTDSADAGYDCARAVSLNCESLMYSIISTRSFSLVVRLNTIVR